MMHWVEMEEMKIGIKCREMKVEMEREEIQLRDRLKEMKNERRNAIIQTLERAKNEDSSVEDIDQDIYIDMNNTYI